MLSGMGWTAIRFIAVTALGFALNLAAQAFGLSQQQAQIAFSISIAIFVAYAAAELAWRLRSTNLKAPWRAQRTRGPITLDFRDGSPLSLSMRKGGAGLAAGEIGSLWVFGLYIKARNRSNERVTLSSVRIESDVTPDTLELQISDRTEPSGFVRVQDALVLPRSHFDLLVRIPSSDPAWTDGISAGAFRARFGSFRIVIICGGKRLVWLFPASLVDSWIKSGETRLTTALNPTPKKVR